MSGSYRRYHYNNNTIMCQEAHNGWVGHVFTLKAEEGNTKWKVIIVVCFQGRPFVVLCVNTPAPFLRGDYETAFFYSA